MYSFIYLLKKTAKAVIKITSKAEQLKKCCAVSWDNIVRSRCIWTTEFNVQNYETLF